MPNQRKFKRFARRVRTSFWRKKRPDQQFTGYTSDISSGGTFITTDKPVGRNGRIQMEFQSEIGAFFMEGLVVRSLGVHKDLRKVKKGDQAFCYHSGKEKSVVGTARFVSDAYQDLSAGDPRMAAAEVEPLEPLPRTVALKEMRGNEKLSGLDLLRISRLSFMPVSPEHWDEILRMAGEPA